MSRSRFSFRNAHGVLLTALFLSLLGAVTYRRMSASIIPDFPFPRIAIIVEAGDMAIQDVVLRLTRPLESAANSVPGASRVVSKTSRGASEISIDFEWGSDLFEAYTRLNAALAQIRSSLPPEADIGVEWVNPSSFPVLGSSLTSSKHSPRDLRELAMLTVAPFLSRQKGVYRVLVQGGETREYQVLADPAALGAAGVSVEQVSAALAGTNLLQSVGRFSQHYQSYLVLGTAQLDNAPQILDVVVAMRGKTPLRVRDIAQVREADQEVQEVCTANGHEAVLLSVLKQQGASTANVSREILAGLKDLRRSKALPDDVTFRAFYDEAELLGDSMTSLRDAILLGALLGMVVLWFFLGSLRSTLIVVLCLPLTVLISFAVLGFALLVAVWSGLAFRPLPTGSMPEMDEGGFVLDYLAPPGTTLEDTDRLCRVMEADLQKTPEVESYARRTGVELGFFATDQNAGDVSVKLKPLAHRRRSMREVMDDVRHRCESKMPSVVFEAVVPLADCVADIAGEPSPLEVKVFGDDPEVLANLSEKITTLVAKVRGTTESIHDVTRSGPELNVRLNPERTARLGLTPEQVIDTLQTALFGKAETVVRSGERLIEIRVLYPKALRRTRDQIRTLPILSATGQQVPLESIADITEGPGYFEVTRENQQPMIPVTAQLEGRDLGSANAEVRQRIEREIKLPPGYTLQYGGLFHTQQESFRSLLTVLMLGMALVFIVLVCQYHGFAEAVALILSGLFSMAGVVLALWLTNVAFNASSFTGAIMIFGMVLANGILLMDAVHDGLREGLPLDEALVHGGRLRLRPVLMTSVIAVLTLLPLAFGLGAGAQMQQPLAVASIGGLTCSPLFTLILAPTLLHVMRRRQRLPLPAQAEGN